MGMKALLVGIYVGESNHSTEFLKGGAKRISQPSTGALAPLFWVGPVKPWFKPICVGNCRGIIIPRFLRWSGFRPSTVASSYSWLQLCGTGNAEHAREISHSRMMDIRIHGF